jgi:hypothetical protein
MKTTLNYKLSIMKNRDKILFWVTFAMGIVVFGLVAYLYATGTKNLIALGGGCLLAVFLLFYKPSWTKGIKDALVGLFTRKK